MASCSTARPPGSRSTARVNRIGGLLDATGSLAGAIDSHPLQGSAHVAKTADGGWAADKLAVSLASARLDGAMTVTADNLATGDLTFSASRTSTTSRRALTKLGSFVQAEDQRRGQDPDGRLCRSSRKAIG